MPRRPSYTATPPAVGAIPPLHNMHRSKYACLCTTLGKIYENTAKSIPNSNPNPNPNA